MVAGLLLTGGAGRRLGQDKAALFAVDLAARLAAATAPTYEIGPGRTALPTVPDPGEGPLAALAAAASVLADDDAVVLACDMPFVTEALLRFLASQPGTAIPVVDGRMQPLCARWSAANLARAPSVVAGGGRAMRALLDDATDVTWLDEAAWSHVATACHFADVDTPDDLVRLGLA
jgi:molybdopterin-guanine dinucleotide biosynthesis protein A